MWELPGGYVDHAKDVSTAAAREVEEEPAGARALWRRRP
ncbi:NUDIX domain-containing protein [Nocardia sp. NPDC051030]